MDQPLFDELQRRLTIRPDHQSFIGTPLDITGLTPLELGRLWSSIRTASRDRSNLPAAAMASSILEQAKHLDLVPVLDEQSCMEVFRAAGAGEIEWAVESLCYMTCEPPAGLAGEMRRVLGDSSTWAADRFRAFALAKLADEATRTELKRVVREKFADCPYVLEEFEILEQLGTVAVLTLARARSARYTLPDGEEPELAETLAGEAAYIEFSERSLRRARQRLQDIHDGKVPYVADGAFTVDDSHIIARCARVASLRDESWFAELIGPLFPQACVAPTSAKTTPAQSLGIALGHSVEAVPTPESVAALREALSVVRHAMLKKKLSRNLKPAERALAARPEIALRITEDTKPGKAQQTMLATCLEGGFWKEFVLSYEEWRRRLLHTSIGKPFAQSLVWKTEQGSFLLDDAAIDCCGKPVSIGEPSRISLWHPLDADDTEREAWRSLISVRQIRQPLRQAFREHYVPDPKELPENATMAFAGHMVSIKPLLGLGGREGWRVDYDELVRVFGDIRAAFRVGQKLYPGLEGSCVSGQLSFRKRQGARWMPVAIDAIRPVVFSEISRAVDLLVSVTGFAIGGESIDSERSARLHFLSEENLSQMARMRANVVARVFEKQIADRRMAIDGRHVRVGPFAVHITTARVTRDGAPVDMPAPVASGGKLVAIPWLPYDESLLEKIVYTVSALLSRPP
jgi:hypothetical protein